MGSMKNWMLAAAVVAAQRALEQRRQGSRIWSLRARTGGLRSALPRTGIRLDRRLHGWRLLGSGKMEFHGLAAGGARDYDRGRDYDRDRFRTGIATLIAPAGS